MPDKKLTDTEIKKALECCSTYHDVSSCKNCPLDGKCEPNMLEQYALDLINRQEKDKSSLIEHLKKSRRQLKTANEKTTTTILHLQTVIAEQQAENESLKAEVERLRKAIEKTDYAYFKKSCEFDNLIYDIELLKQEKSVVKAEAYKEFAEKLKEYTTQGFWETDAYVGAEQIDNLLNELVGENNGKDL